MNQVKKFQPQRPADGGLPVHARQFVFFDKKTGTRRFEVKAGEDGSVCLDQAVKKPASTSTLAWNGGWVCSRVME